MKVRAALVTMAVVMTSTAVTHATPARTGRALVGYDLTILGFNGGEPYRIKGAQADAVLGERSAVVWRFTSTHWMNKTQAGGFVSAAQVAGNYPNRPAGDLFSVYQADLEGDGTAEVLLVPVNDQINNGKRYAPTILKRTPRGYKPLRAVNKLPGERFAVVDMRDLDGNGAPEILFRGEAGSRGFYHFHELMGRAGETFASLPVKHVNSVHYVDLDRNGQSEIVVRERVSRRGPANQWTYVDQLYAWSGEQFTSAIGRFPRYHDVQTLPTLVGELIDHYAAELPILRDKVRAIRRVRGSVIAGKKKPPQYDRKVVRALANYENGRVDKARLNLNELERQYPYDLQMLLGLARLHAQAALELKDSQARRQRFEKALDAAIRALTVDPESREAWWWSGVGFIQVRERSSGLASLSNAVRLTGHRRDGLAFLKARRGEPGMDGELQAAIDTTLETLGQR